jgi:hypothetical protein
MQLNFAPCIRVQKGEDFSKKINLFLKFILKITPLKFYLQI